MIKKHSDDPDVAHAASQALKLIQTILADLPKASHFDYGGHDLKLGEYDVCVQCTTPIAEAQAARKALLAEAEKLTDDTLKEHLQLAAELYRLEAEAAAVRAEFHNGHNTENILNQLLAFQYVRGINENYEHSHHQGAES